MELYFIICLPPFINLIFIEMKGTNKKAFQLRKAFPNLSGLDGTPLTVNFSRIYDTLGNIKIVGGCNRGCLLIKFVRLIL